MTSAARVNFLAIARGFETASKLAIYVVVAKVLFDNTGSGLIVSTSLFLFYITSFVMTPLAGWVVDGFSKKLIMTFSCLIAGSIYFLMGIFDATLFIILASIPSAIFESPFAPATNAALPKLVANNRLVWANSRVAVGRNFGYLSGPLLAGLALGFGNPLFGFLLAGILAWLAVPFVWLSLNGFVENNQQNQTDDGDENVFAGLLWLKTQRQLVLIILCVFFVYLSFGISLPGEVALAQFFGASSFVYGLIVAAWGIGNVLGSLAMPFAKRFSFKWILFFGFFLAAVSFGAVTISTSVTFALVAILLGGFGEGMAMVASGVLLQEKTPAKFLGRVFAVYEAVNTIGFALPLLFAGLMLDQFGVKTLYLAAGVACLLGALVLLFVEKEENVNKINSKLNL